MAEQANDPTPRRPANAESVESAAENAGDAQNVESVREGMSERAGEGGYGNDTGFATGTRAPRDGEEGGTSGREDQIDAEYGA